MQILRKNMLVCSSIIQKISMICLHIIALMMKKLNYWEI